MRAERREQPARRRGAHAVRNTQPLPAKPESGVKRVLLRTALAIAALAACVALFAPQLSGQRAQLVSAVSKPISKLQIEDQWQRVNEAEVMAILRRYVGSGFFEFDLDGVSRDLEALPWVASVELRRVWPDTLVLHLKEEVPIAQWGQGHLLNQYGQLFSPSNAADFTDLPRLQGPDASQDQVMQQYKQLSQVLMPAGLRLNALELNQRGSWSMVINTMRVEAGRGDVLNKTQRFARFYVQQDSAETAQFESVDLRYGNGIAVKKKALILAPLSDVAQR